MEQTLEPGNERRRHPRPERSLVRTFGLTHIVLTVADAERSLGFYERVFGVREYWRDGGQIQATTPGAHDVIAFNQGKRNIGRTGGIEHFGFRLVDPRDIDEAVRLVLDAGGELVERGDFGAGQPFAFVKDPDGYLVEIWYE